MQANTNPNKDKHVSYDQRNEEQIKEVKTPNSLASTTSPTQSVQKNIYKSEEINTYYNMRATQELLKARLRYPDIRKLQDGTTCVACIPQLIRANKMDEFTNIFGQSVGEELFEAFQSLKLRHDSNEYCCPIKTNNPTVMRKSSISEKFDNESVNQDQVELKNKYRLWKFILCLLELPNLNKFINWSDKQHGIFTVTEQTGTRALAELWGQIKQNPRMDYDKLSRSLRAYYDKNKLIKHNARLHYQFNLEDPEVKQFRQLLETANKNSENKIRILDEVKDIIQKWSEKNSK